MGSARGGSIPLDRTTPRRKALTFVALLRAVNVRGTGKLPMDDPLLLRVKAGFDKVQT